MKGKYYEFDVSSLVAGGQTSSQMRPGIILARTTEDKKSYVIPALFNENTSEYEPIYSFEQALLLEIYPDLLRGDKEFLASQKEAVEIINQYRHVYEAGEISPLIGLGLKTKKEISEDAKTFGTRDWQNRVNSLHNPKDSKGRRFWECFYSIENRDDDRPKNDRILKDFDTELSPTVLIETAKRRLAEYPNKFSNIDLIEKYAKEMRNLPQAQKTDETAEAGETEGTTQQ
jgi:hypothetical protein